MAGVQVNKRVLWLIGFLFVAVPVVVGVLVWHFTKTDQPPSLANTFGGNVTAPKDAPSTSPPSSTTPTPEEVASKPWLGLRLPTSQIPLHYDIVLYPDFYDDNSTFYGNETVDVEIARDTRYVLIHVFEQLHVETASLRDAHTNATLALERFFYFKDHEFLVVETKETVPAGSVVQLSLQFRGLLNESIVGFYKSSYVNSLTNETRYLATSKFEPVSARRAFPCMDEPALKAQFSVTLIHRPGYVALSNMPPRGPPAPAEGYPGLLATSFQKSVKMSTYLVCFIVCDFQYTGNFTNSGTEVRVYATPDKVSQTVYALSVAVSTLEEYERLFNISYPLPKQDLIAIPDFVSGAMEHWGLITFREVNLLYDPAKTSEAGKQRVATVVAHEVSHQWFGNLVTMAWWNDLWLNEGFATFMEYLGAASVEKDWEMMQQFITEESQPVMVTDAGVSSHPIIVNVNKPDEINEVFDVISYSKGAAVIRMLEAIIGKEKFFEGISHYLKKHEWGNAVTDDLWQALSEVDGAHNVKHIMDTWTLQMGFPYVSLSFSTSANTTTIITATQSRFLADPGHQATDSESPFKYKWYIVLDCLTSSGSKNSSSMELENATFLMNVDISESSSDWVKCNLNQTGFYRVNYPPFMWKNMAVMLRDTPEELGAADRSGLLDDAMSLARAGLLDYDVALEMTSYLNKEDNYIPWRSTFTSLTYISSMLSFDTDFALWRKFVLGIVTPSLSRLGWADVGSHNQRSLRGVLIDLACRHEDPACFLNTTAQFRDWLDHGIEPAVNVKSHVYKYGIWAGSSADDWESLWERYKVEVVPQERTSLLGALAMTRTPWLLERLLDYAREGVFIRRQDFIVVVQLVAANPAARGLLWNWVRRNWSQFVDRFTLFDRYFGQVVPYTTSNFNTDFDKEQVEEFLRKYPEAGAGARGRKQALDRIQQNIYWMTNFKPVVTKWLRHKA